MNALNYRTWKVDRVSLSTEAKKHGRAAYPFHVEGAHTDNGAQFYWNLPSIVDTAYDLTTALVDEDVARFAVAYWIVGRAS